MKIHSKMIVVASLCLSLLPASAQMAMHPGGMGGPEFGGSMQKLFGKNSEFSAAMEMQVQSPAHGGTMTIPGKIAVADGKARFEMDMGNMKGGRMRPGAAAQMKAMGMDKMVTISLPKEKMMYMVYPGLKAYAAMPIRNPEAAKPESDFKIHTTELGKETVDGHPCVKNKAVVTDDHGNKHESTVWNATDLKDFPVKIESSEQGNTTTMTFKNVKLSKPDSSLFEPPSTFKKYDTIMELMQQEVMKRMGGGGAGMPPHQ